MDHRHSDFIGRVIINRLWRHMATGIWVNIGSGNGFLPNDTISFP